MSKKTTPPSAPPPPSKNPLGLRQWDLVWIRFRPEDRDEHPAVIVSPEEVLNSHVALLNVLYGTSATNAGVGVTQVYLDDADRLDHGTTVDCAVIQAVNRSKISRRVGQISTVRIAAIKRKLIAILRLT